MIAELWTWLLLSTTWSSLAIVLVAASRRPVRRRFGCGVAYALWLLPPVAVLATALPAPPTPVALAEMMAVSTLQGVAADIADTPARLPRFTDALLALWALGVLVSALGFARRQYRFRQRLGRLSSRGDGCWRAGASPAFGPAVIGLLCPRIVLPDDFEATGSDSQRRLILAHERCHVRRGDLWAHLVALVLRCLFWFNPLVHWALARFRHDQELACDAAVMARHPGTARDYADAMLDAATLDASVLHHRAPLLCAWPHSFDLKERIQMLKLPQAPTSTRRFGLATVALVTALFATAVWSMQSSDPARDGTDDEPLYLVVLNLTLPASDSGGATDRHAVEMLVAAGKRFSVAGEGARPWRAEFDLQPLPENTFHVQSRLELDGEVIGEPSLTVLADKDASIEVGGDDAIGYRMDLRVSDLTPENDPRSRALSVR